jgi:hypothetical protein
MNPNSKLQIRIHGTDGSLSPFNQHEPALIEQIIKDVQRHDLFAQPRIIIASKSSLTTFVASKIARIDLEGEPVLAWKPKPSSKAPDLVEISEQEFLCQAEGRDLKNITRGNQRHTPGQRFVGFLDIQLVSGLHIYLKFHGLAALPAERLQKIQSFLTLPSLSFRFPGGGFGVVNLSNATKFTACPGPAEVPTGAWLANEEQTRQ